MGQCLQRLRTWPWSSMVTVVGLTGSSTYAFYAVVQELSSKLPADFKPCTESEGCLYLRLLSSKHLSSTQVRNLDPEVRGSWAEAMPAFVLIRNGHNMTWSSIDSIWHDHRFHPVSWLYVPDMPIWFLYIPVSFVSIGPWALLDTLKAETRLYRSPIAQNASSVQAMDSLCNSEEVRKGIYNHLNEAVAVEYLYICGLVGWGTLKAVHDVALLAGAPERFTLRLGIGSFIFQAGAAGMGLFWCSGAFEVFVSKVDEESACYFQLGAVDCLLALVTPALLIYYTICKARSLCFSVQYGDYLYAISYDVPYRIVHATAPDHPTESLLLPALAGAESVEPAPLQRLSDNDYVVLAESVFFIEYALFLLSWFTCIPVLANQALPKLIVVLAQSSYGHGPIGIAKIFAVVIGVVVIFKRLVWICNAIPIFAQRTDRRWFPFLASNMPSILALLAVPFVAVPMLSMPEEEFLDHAWLCSACCFIVLVTGFTELQWSAETPSALFVMGHRRSRYESGAQSLSVPAVVRDVDRLYPEYQLAPLVDPDNPASTPGDPCHHALIEETMQRHRRDKEQARQDIEMGENGAAGAAGHLRVGEARSVVAVQ